MTRIRLVFVLMALVLLASLALIVDKARESVRAERDLRHRALADRLVDEMERELSAWLSTEEDRPFAQYRYFAVPEDSASQLVSLTRSPLSQLPSEPFLVCYFQIDPDGTVSSPLWPNNEELARVATDWQPSPEIRAYVDLVQEAVGDFWSFETAAPRGLPALEGLQLADAGGLTVALELPEDDAPGVAPKRKVPPGKKRSDLVKGKALDEPARENEKSLLSQLNRGASSRRERPTKVAPSQAANVYNFLEDDASVLQQALQDLAESAEEEDEGAPAPAELVTTNAEIEQRVLEVLDTSFSATIDVRLQPMIGRPATDQHLVLYRTVSIGDETYSQGLMLDMPQLVTWAAKRVLADSDLAATARVVPVTPTKPSVVRGLSKVTSRIIPPAYSYRHHFAEPFSEVAADIFLDQLPERRSLLNLTSLSLLLALTATFGLFALYRMVAVVVAYSERRNNFVSAVTHELKTPLTALRMYSEMLRDGMVRDEAKRRQYYETLTSETERLTRLVQNVLELSQLEQQNRPMKMEVGDVVPVVEEVLEILGPHAEQQGFALRLTAEDPLPKVRYDRDALVQVLVNLVDNALKYSRDAATKEVTLSCRHRDGGVVLTVADHGPGVPRQQLKKIFEPFYRTENELTRTSKGTGIGLALVRGLVERMGGTVKGHNRDGGFEIAVRLAAA